MSDGEKSADRDTSKETGIAAGIPPVPNSSRQHFGTEETPSILKYDENTALHVFFAWEKLRLAYNAALLFVIPIQISFGFEFPYLLLKAIGANVVFCVGPVVEGYLVCLGVPPPLPLATFLLWDGRCGNGHNRYGKYSSVN